MRIRRRGIDCRSRAFLHDETYHRPDEAELEGIYEQREVKGWARYMAHPELKAKVEELGITSLAQFYTSEAKYDPVVFREDSEKLRRLWSGSTSCRDRRRAMPEDH
jgi:hypothetical protein